MRYIWKQSEKAGLSGNHIYSSYKVNMNIFNLLTISFATLFAFVSIAVAEELSTPYIVENACPFEGCTFGEWSVLKNAMVHEAPNKNSKVVTTLIAGSVITVETGVIYVTPGRAIVTGKPYRTASSINPKEEVLLLDYIGEGYSRIYQGGIYYETKIAREKNQCKDNPNWRYCWVEVIEEPIVKWWVKVKDKKIEKNGWVLMEGEVLKAIDAFSHNLPYNPSFNPTANSSFHSLTAAG
jgi:hypothetical protein